MHIIPAILTQDSDEALAEIAPLRGVAQWLQIDVMDGTMTADVTFDLFELCGEVDDFNVEVHLMVDEPVQYLQACAAVGAQRVYIHPEPLPSVTDVFAAMSEYDFARGLAIAPQTTLEQVLPYIDEVDAVQIMTVEPGEQGQPFMPEMLEKVRDLKGDLPSLWVAVDGGVNAQTIGAVRDAGADAAGVGSAISGAADPAAAFRTLSAHVQ